jgi:hypothetical protein
METAVNDNEGDERWCFEIFGVIQFFVTECFVFLVMEVLLSESVRVAIFNYFIGNKGLQFDKGAKMKKIPAQISKHCDGCRNRRIHRCKYLKKITL